ncbi:40S small subunit processome assembly factor 1 [Leptodactylus fuscus]|uniref:40S small subunit processome assembly factor 1 n=1 Tax=Leptodactylus fuscus TaxID=238119 RepID=UPI003F4E534C
MAEVRDQLDSVLGSLYDFGEDFGTHEEDKPLHEQMNGLVEKKDANTANGSAEVQKTVIYSKRSKKTVSMFFDSIKDELCSQAKNPIVSSSAAKPSSVEVVTFVSRKDKKQSKDKDIQNANEEKNTDNAEKDNSLQFDFEKARLEVHKFGITGYKKETQRKFEQERAIMLGAKAPKREHVNYKVYQEKLKEKAQAQKEMENGMEPARKKQKRGKNDKRSRKPRGSVSAPSGQVGRFKNGALLLSGKDIEKIKKSRVIK